MRASVGQDEKFGKTSGGVHALCLPVCQRGLSDGTTPGLRGALENVRALDCATGGSGSLFDEWSLISVVRELKQRGYEPSFNPRSRTVYLA